MESILTPARVITALGSVVVSSACLWVVCKVEIFCEVLSLANINKFAFAMLCFALFERKVQQRLWA
jgi:hypothetical protein